MQIVNSGLEKALINQLVIIGSYMRVRTCIMYIWPKYGFVTGGTHDILRLSLANCNYKNYITFVLVHLIHLG